MLHNFHKSLLDECFDKVEVLKQLETQTWQDINQARIDRCIRRFKSGKCFVFVNLSIYFLLGYSYLFLFTACRPVPDSSSERTMSPINRDDGPSLVKEQHKHGRNPTPSATKDTSKEVPTIFKDKSNSEADKEKAASKDKFDSEVDKGKISKYSKKSTAEKKLYEPSCWRINNPS